MGSVSLYPESVPYGVVDVLEHARARSWRTGRAVRVYLVDAIAGTHDDVGELPAAVLVDAWTADNPLAAGERAGYYCTVTMQ